MLSVVFAIIALTAFQIEVTEPLKSLALMIIWYYFWGKKDSQSDNWDTTTVTTSTNKNIEMWTKE